MLFNLGIGLGGVVVSPSLLEQYKPQPQYLYNTVTNERHYLDPQYCIHGDNCEECKKRKDIEKKLLEKIKLADDKKREDYKKRCKKYMSNFRSKYETT